MPSEHSNPASPLPGLPPELAALDAELAALRMTERPSFAPELKAELEREALRPPTPPRATRRWPLAAAVVVLVLVGAAVPPARASLVRAGGTLIDLLDGSAEATPSRASPGQDEVRTTQGSAPPGEEAADPDPALAAVAPPASSHEAVPFTPPTVTLPEIVDEREDARVMRRYYPPRLQAAGVGGTVHLLLWVDSTGAVDHVQIHQGSGLGDLDRAALAAAPHLRFRPATHSGRPVGTWVEFPLRFEVTPPDPPAQPPPMGLPEVPDRAPAVPAEWTGEAIVPAPTQMEARELLRSALGDHPAIEARFGTLDGLLEGEPPRGASPLAWRDQAAAALEHAMARDPDNPAPYLALARIRRRQGLSEEARALFERGIQRARRAGDRVSPQLVAELAYERALVLKEEVLLHGGGGSVDPAVLAAHPCGRVGDPLRQGSPGVGEALIAWSTLCPDQLDRVLEAGFRPAAGADEARAAMTASLKAAVEADPAHVGANVELLLELAEQESWHDVLNGARRFGWASGGHPYALLLSGLALKRLGRAGDAAADLRRGLAGLAPDEAERIADPRVLMDAHSAARLTDMMSEDRQRATRDFWAPLDPVLATDVNERFVEHLVRGAHALLRFGAAATDPGEVWVRYGRPDRVRVLGEGSGARTEFWDYGRGPDVTFRRRPSARTADLTAEARAYLEDLRNVFPHRGDDAGANLALPAQVARFRGEHGLDLEIHAVVPDIMAAGEGDSLELGLHQFGSAGERVSIERRRITARDRQLRLIARSVPGATRLAVEVYDPRLGRAAVASIEPVARAGDPRASDLLLTAPAAGGGAGAHHPRGGGTLALPDETLEGDEVGVFFELYDLPPDAPPYGIRVEVASPDGGSALDVPFRPAGQPWFDMSWFRRPVPGPSAGSEWLTLDLRDVPPGSYRLRVVVQVEDPSGDIVLERPVLRR
ncbi:MAG: energy transducer TonB [Gemmatimonadetes bacterium]|nr:energy transducer TonB [Gemmatimonadota bacterium]